MKCLSQQMVTYMKYECCRKILEGETIGKFSYLNYLGEKRLANCTFGISRISYQLEIFNPL